METKELMIGDLVIHGFGGIGKITEIGNKTVVIKDDGFDTGDGMNEVSFAINELKPIFITRKILEKNGFKFEQQGSLEVAILKMKNRHPITLEYIGWSDGRWSIHEHRLVVKYVHELQHALRLCGVNKEISI